MHDHNFISVEDTYLINFSPKTPIVIEHGSGVDVWDTTGKHYLDFTAGWAVTSLGHSDPVIVNALIKQAQKIIHNPDSSLTYSPARSDLLLELVRVLPTSLHHFFFVNSGAEANDAALKLSRKITGRKKVISTERSFHGRTIGTTSVTGQTIQRDRYHVRVPFCEFIPYDDIDAATAAIDGRTAAVIVEPIQGEGGVRVPDTQYLRKLSEICRRNGALLIVDEIQTGFWRTGPAFVSTADGIVPDFLTMAKGIAGGFPFGAVAVSGTVADKIDIGDHGGTYCGNPLGCAIAAATIRHCREIYIEQTVRNSGKLCKARLAELKNRFPHEIKEIRGRGLLFAIEFTDEKFTDTVRLHALEHGLILNVKHGTIIRIFPALTIDESALLEGLDILEQAICACTEKEAALTNAFAYVI